VIFIKPPAGFLFFYQYQVFLQNVIILQSDK